VVKKAVSVNSIDWNEYFVSIKSVCPWSGAYWRRQKIQVTPWRGSKMVQELGDYVARIHIHTHASGRQLCNLHRTMNIQRPHEEWLYSHPQYKGHSTPVPVLIQQNLEILTKAREQNAHLANSKTSNNNN